MEQPVKLGAEVEAEVGVVRSLHLELTRPEKGSVKDLYGGEAV